MWLRHSDDDKKWIFVTVGSAAIGCFIATILLCIFDDLTTDEESYSSYSGLAVITIASFICGGLLGSTILSASHVLIKRTMVFWSYAHDIAFATALGCSVMIAISYLGYPENSDSLLEPIAFGALYGFCCAAVWAVLHKMIFVGSADDI